MRGNDYQPIPLSAHMVRETVDELAAGLVANPELGSPTEKVRMLLAAITTKCAFCATNEFGQVGLNNVADCADEGCPLNPYGPSTYKVIRAKLESGGYIAAGVQ